MKIYNSRTQFVLEAINQDMPLQRNVLDVGFIGDYEEAEVHYNIVDALRESDRLVGLDIDKKKMEIFLDSEKTKLRVNKYNLQYEIGSIFDTRFSDNTFSHVLMLEVFEHLFSPYSSLNEIKRVLRPGGSFIVTYPNPLGITRFIKYYFKNDLLDDKFIKEFRGNPEHMIFPHPVCFAIYLKELGFEVRMISFIKYDFKYFPSIHKMLARIGITTKFSSYIGIHAIKQ